MPLVVENPNLERKLVLSQPSTTDKTTLGTLFSPLDGVIESDGLHLPQDGTSKLHLASDHREERKCTRPLARVLHRSCATSIMLTATGVNWQVTALLYSARYWATAPLLSHSPPASRLFPVVNLIIIPCIFPNGTLVHRVTLVPERCSLPASNLSINHVTPSRLLIDQLDLADRTTQQSFRAP